MESILLKKIKIMKCANCQKFITRKCKTQKYCCECNAVVGRRKSKEKRDASRQDKYLKEIA